MYCIVLYCTAQCSTVQNKLYKIMSIYLFIILISQCYFQLNKMKIKNSFRVFSFLLNLANTLQTIDLGKPNIFFFIQNLSKSRTFCSKSWTFCSKSRTFSSKSWKFCLKSWTFCSKLITFCLKLFCSQFLRKFLLFFIHFLY